MFGKLPNGVKAVKEALTKVDDPKGWISKLPDNWALFKKFDMGTRNQDGRVSRIAMQEIKSGNFVDVVCSANIIRRTNPFRYTFNWHLEALT